MNKQDLEAIRDAWEALLELHRENCRLTNHHKEYTTYNDVEDCNCRTAKSWRRIDALLRRINEEKA